MTSHTISTIYSDGKYSGWPTIARSEKTGRIFVVFSGDRHCHICPFGKVMMITSDDEGKTWSPAKVLYNGSLDDRDAGVLVTSKGTVLVSWFNSMAYRYFMNAKGSVVDELPASELEQWQKISAGISDKCLANELGCWMIRSEDNGESFSEKIPTIANSPHGPTELSDGRLLYIGKLRDNIKKYEDAKIGTPHSNKLGVSESTDDGKSWHIICDKLPLAKGHLSKEYHEYHAVQANDVRIIAQIRNHNTTDDCPAGTWQMESSDEGHSWSTPHSIGVHGFPSHLLKLSDGRLLMSYSHRSEPIGNYARLSVDNGQSWSKPFVFGPAKSADMGYSSSIELPDKTILSVWYEQIGVKQHAVIRMAHWITEY